MSKELRQPQDQSSSPAVYMEVSSDRRERPSNHEGGLTYARGPPGFFSRTEKLNCHPSAPARYTRTGVFDLIVRTTPSADDISIVCVSTTPRPRTAPSSSVPLVTPVAAKTTSPDTRSPIA